MNMPTSGATVAQPAIPRFVILGSPVGQPNACCDGGTSDDRRGKGAE